nr:EOG090X0D34 [Sida crystallina]
MFTGFGQTAAQQQPTLSFGAPSAPQNPASTSFGFGAAAPAASSAAPSFGFGAPTFSAAPPASTGFQFGATTSSVAPSFGFGGQTNTTASTGFPLGAAPASSAPSFSFSGGTGGLGTGGFGLIGAATSSAPSFSGLTTNVITTTTTAPSLGLGGISSAPFGGESAASTVQGKADSKALKELPVPNEISQHVEEFKKHVKDQKSMKEEVSRGSSKALEKVGEEVETLKNLLANLANNIQQHSALLHKLKHDSALEIQNAEIAQRTKETAPSLQLDNTSPVEYFFRLVADFEQRMQFYKQQIENTERNLLAMNRQQTLTPRELMDTMKKLHEAFLLLCGRVQSVHSALQNCKDDYLSYRRRFLGDSTDIFAPKGSVGVKTALASQLQSRAGTGPSPFGGY